ncbi:MAG: mechanosensitive ion channel family protein [Calditrichae bacterium]|nr:mechanosensitive ion channel family protein [Calditrichota bacterium]MCB9057687.1 mechanosensitive ion channel family protein [Calditrichia bacterium]
MTENLKKWISEFTPFGDFVLFLLLFALAIIVFLVLKKIILKIAEKFIRRTKIKFDDYILNSGVFERAALLIPVLILYNAIYLFPGWESFFKNGSGILIAIIISRTLAAFTTGLSNYYSTLEIARQRPIKGYIQVLNLLIYMVAVIFIIALLTGESPWELLAGLGALTAVLLLIFRDTILSFVASLQIASNDLVHVGDWIEMPKYGADGDVIDIALHTIKVQNWDKTITVIPTYKLIEESFKNWRGMTAAGGRRIKRAIHIDLNTIEFCTDEMLDRFEKIRLIADYIQNKRTEISNDPKNKENENINKRRLTNIGTFRIYIEKYIQSHPKIHKDLTCMVRQLAPTAQGLPLEIYMFTNDTAWVNYEAIQSDIFDHILAIISEFGLRVYQQPAGHDMARIQVNSPNKQ